MQKRKKNLTKIRSEHVKQEHSYLLAEYQEQRPQLTPGTRGCGAGFAGTCKRKRNKNSHPKENLSKEMQKQLYIAISTSGTIPNKYVKAKQIVNMHCKNILHLTFLKTLLNMYKMLNI